MSALKLTKFEIEDHKRQGSTTHLLENNTTNTEIFPNTANNTTPHTDHRNQCEPIMSSQGFKASDFG
jgi:hypothetical protein